ncbi:hypothetical protein [Marivirga harenae]|uniref:hypothetical protein n=1 Tax=Marivirga harenae TaxID=2010992 RepID=UPI0026E0A059|nr:hypothetical protein [Marivirga harenae]WKV11365.1 hypothetical protein Q3Y49_14245 [Marivirga harenae]
MRILLNFNYDRNQWLELLKPLFPSNEIHWLRYISKTEDQNKHLESHQYHYWSDYASAQETLIVINPDVIIIMDNKSPLSIALIYSAKNAKIPVYYLQHGVLASYKDYKILEANLISTDNNRIEKLSELKAKAGFSTFSYFKNSLGLRFFHPKTILYLLIAKKYGERTAAYLIKDEIRIPDKYLCFSVENAKLHFELDGNIEKRINVVGFPELEKIVREYEKVTSENSNNYWLHIDQPLSGGDLGEQFISEEKHHQIYLSLSQKAAENQSMLYVKLHPGSFLKENLPQDENIVYLREVESLAFLIKNARVCTGFYSSLLLPCIAFKPTILIKIIDLSWYTSMSKYPNVFVTNDILEIENIPQEANSDDSDKFLAVQGYFEDDSFEDRVLKKLQDSTVFFEEK